MWNGDKLRPRAGPIHADALGVRAKMTPPGKTIAAMSTSDVAFADNKIARRKAFHVIADKIDHADKFMADRHRHRNRFLGPGVPIIYVDVGAADGRLQDANEDIICACFRNRDFLEPQAGLGFSLHDGLHRFLHDKKLGGSVTQETKNCSTTASVPDLKRAGDALPYNHIIACAWFVPSR